MAWIKIRVGSGVLMIDDGLGETMRNRYLVLRTRMENGPCQDGMCQIIRQIDASLEDQVPDNMLFFGDQQIRIAMDTQTYRSINKGRESLKIRLARAGIQVSGFTYVT
ncbi:hypothetical protein [Thermoplasma sp. Kam2015]|uniref:hypothetical protein n=1 Tax=Thermoplasma sp. Kam2015 TaxID=2094122 RepID=UPI001F2A77B0|nr:hypothetical protein [Thermoplasma sp. Kam2015]